MTDYDHEPDAASEATAYRPKAELWQGLPEKPTPMWARAILIGLVLVTLPVIAVAFEPYFLSLPMGQVEVTVLQVAGGAPAGDGTPASYRHVVSLADGTRLNFTAESIHRPGEKLLVTASRGRITGRVRLSTPYRLFASP